MISAADIEALFERQMTSWPEAAARIRDLETRVQRRSVGPYTVQFNPARAVSTLAKTDVRSLAERPCFLCAANRPAVQEGLSILDNRWEVLINPFPILRRHLTIVSTTHSPQRLTPLDFADMVRISQMLPDYVVFYNGARCGASAPDHKHLQAGLIEEGELRIPTCIEAIPFSTADELQEMGDRDVNILIHRGQGYIIPRRQHRPDCYHEGTLMVSPGALDMAGIIITPRESDFLQISAEQITAILQQCGTPAPTVSVGIMEAPEIHHTPTPDGFTLHGVTIGKDFHWQRLQDQSFQGSLRIVTNPNTGLQVAINDVAIEDYLASVISSEMSGTSSLELLKAHAVISRSWVRKMKTRHVDLSELGSDTPDTHTRWYDTASHTLFDVCADDHCQRYQGRQGITPMVARAIAATRGLVLVDSRGELCDARFSKCCGGRTELFSTCWEDRDYDYLQSVECPYCNTQDAHLLSQVLNSYDQETAHFHRWQVRYTQQELSDIAEQKLHLHLGTIQELIPLHRGPSGRISSLRVVGSLRTLVIGKELEIRRLLSPTHLYSSAFAISREGTDFILDGSGWGHGVGLCQIGAAVMADQGYSFRQILAHYYPQSQIKNKK